jgi:gamma-glutamylcyclotransferase (GGCT)/AIG2-like uncharacterized protein YtfP
MASRLTTGPVSLFAYGTLQFPEVLTALLDRVPAHTPGAVAGWRAAALPSLNYPGLVAAGGTVRGVLLSGLTAREWRIIDAYEDDRYELERLALTDGRYGWAYLYARDGEVLPHDWSADEFAERHLAAFARQCRAWRDLHQAGRPADSPGSYLK